MNEKPFCGNEQALIAFLYDEGDPAEREAIAAHVARCTTCADDIESLRLTRAQLSKWAPPDAALGFRITQAPAPSHVEGPPSNVLTRARWFTQPLPAWAQMAAAVVIFAGGVGVGAISRDDNGEVATTAPSASQEDLDALRAEVVDLRNRSTAATPAVGATPVSGSVDRVTALVDARVRASETQQRREFDRRTAQLVRDIQIARAGDLATVQETINGYRQELLEQRDAIRRANYMGGGGGQVVPTSLR